MNKKSHLLLTQLHSGVLINKKLDGALSYHGISATEFIIMHHLKQAVGGALSRVKLAEQVGLSASGVTRLLAPMTKNNIVEKLANPRDARQSQVCLTETGKQLYQDASVSFQHYCESVFTLLSDKEVETFLQLLNKVKC